MKANEFDEEKSKTKRKRFFYLLLFSRFFCFTGRHISNEKKNFRLPSRRFSSLHQKDDEVGRNDDVEVRCRRDSQFDLKTSKIKSRNSSEKNDFFRFFFSFFFFILLTPSISGRLLNKSDWSIDELVNNKMKNLFIWKSMREKMSYLFSF